MAIYYEFPHNYVLLDKLQWPEPLGETHNIKLHRKATVPVFTPDLSFSQQSGLSITLKFLFHAQCIWLLSPKAWHECLQACPDGRPPSSSSFAFEYRRTLPFPASVELPVIHSGHLQKMEGGNVLQLELVGGSAHQGRKAGETHPCWGQLEEDCTSPGLKRLRALH